MTVTAPDAIGTTYQSFHRHLADGLAPQQRMYAELSGRAKVMQSLSPCEIPGQLQTPEWARAVFSYNPGFADDDQRTDIDAAVEARMARGAQLTAGSCHFHLLTTTYPLRFRCDWPQLSGQIDRLIQAALSEDYQFGIIPDKAGTRQPPYSPVCIYDGTRAEVETYCGMLYVTDAPDVAAAQRSFDKFAQAALYGQEAAALLRSLRAELLGD